ncbi:glycine--tRNA ligase subunit beta [Helicobacter cynogastricus]|uniref:glycine--tRNA ligase subunit beta n=1 Tax=Helicobacter cynogastricus TaxID=329937 RepID=UPI000CF067FF|nr:glycine--tRNA ligase subunit beta [Helicobacter cynogastricus]
MDQALLIEILVEEMPAKPLLHELPNIPQKFYDSLEKHGLGSTALEVFYTPTRLVLYAPSFPTHTLSITEEFFGPPLDIGTNIEKEGTRTLNPVGLKFYAKLNLPPNLEVGMKNNKEVLYATKRTQPIPTATLLDDILLHFLGALDFGKSMAWGALKARFIRPIHNLCVIFGSEDIDLSACTSTYGCSAKRATKLHFSKGFDYHNTPDISTYFKTLEEGFVILDPLKRRARILDQIHALESQHDMRVEVDPELLEEIIAITAYPTALYGQFKAHFLQLPAEIATTSMQTHQRYFPTFKDSSLHHGFVVVSNLPSKGDFSQIIAGNEKVLKARLSDAIFFYQNDLQTSLEWEVVSSKLEQISFMQGLGSLKDKVEREQRVGAWLVDRYGEESMRPLVQKILELAKADLCSEVVYEFPELQGVMGGYYAKHHNHPQEVCQAIQEQYLPTSENAPLPSSLLAALSALAIKLDTLLSLFSVGKIPTGSKDPFALRRACNGILRICLHYQLDFNLSGDLQAIARFYAPFEWTLLQDFILERFTHVLGDFNPSFYKAVLKGLQTLKSENYGVCQIAHKVQALHAFFAQENTADLVAIFKRVANITQLDTLPQTNPALFTDPSEHALYETYENIVRMEFSNFLDKLKALSHLKQPLESFFERVLVNDPNLQVQNNRKGLLALIYHAFLNVADIKDL